jgi:dipeptidyl aminopeptidase/acylaminoacyl peptidase
MHRASKSTVRFTATFTLLCLAPALSSQDKKPIQVEDLYREDQRRALLKVPNQNRAYFWHTWIDKMKKERHALSIVVDPPKGKVVPAEDDEPDARQPLLSPDGKWLVFLSTRPRPKDWKQTPPVPPYSDAAVDLWVLSTAGGKAIPLAGPEKPYGRVFHDGFYGRVAFAPDGKRLVFVADDGSDPRSAEETANNVRIVREDQGEGYTGYGPAQIWVAHLDATPGAFAAKKIYRLTKDDVWYGDPHWSPDGQFLAVHANKSSRRESVRFSINQNYDIFVLSAAGGKQTQLTNEPGPEVSPRFAPDGKRVICLSVPRCGAHRELFNLMLITKGEQRPRVLFDHHGENAESPPHPAPAFPLPSSCWKDNDSLTYTSEHGVRDASVQIDVNTAMAITTQVDEKMPTLPNTLKDRLLAETKVIKYKSEEWTIEAVLTVPPAEVAKAPYKLLVLPHGGPHSRARVAFNFNAQVFAGQGYLVFEPNFRGSSGYSQKFLAADRYDLGGGDMRDILAGVEHLVKEGLANPKQQYVYGVSYGGFMTSWLVGKTSQFRAAVTVNAVTDHTMMWSLSDIPSWTEWEFGGRPWEQPERYRKHSPLTHVDKVKTPTLVLHSQNDRRCPLPMGQAFHQALSLRGVPTQMVIYPDENHGIRQPRHREDVLRRILAWFAKHAGE